MKTELPVGATIGILGGGQLGRMLALAAARLGFKCHIYDPNNNAPAIDISAKATIASYENKHALISFAKDVDVVTYEFENIPTTALDQIEAFTEIHPNRKALQVSQDRFVEKEFLNSLGLKTAPYIDVKTDSDLKRALRIVGVPAILKTRTLGYDGKGQFRISNDDEAAQVMKKISSSSLILEGVVDFSKEISVIGARNVNGQVTCYDPGENIHSNGILKNTTVPALVSRNHLTDAVLLTANILNSLDYIGVLGVELFVSSEGLIVNEIAPRVHNSGHWTQNGCLIDQFEQHIRAISGWTLGDGSRHSDITMENIIGDAIEEISLISRDPEISIHLYGKSETRPGRKMGHTNKILKKN